MENGSLMEEVISNYINREILITYAPQKKDEQYIFLTKQEYELILEGLVCLYTLEQNEKNKRISDLYNRLRAKRKGEPLITKPDPAKYDKIIERL